MEVQAQRSRALGCTVSFGRANEGTTSRKSSRSLKAIAGRIKWNPPHHMVEIEEFFRILYTIEAEFGWLSLSVVRLTPGCANRLKRASRATSKPECRPS